MKSYDSILVAKYMLAIAKDRNISLNVTKVQKLLYILYGYYLANYDNHQIIEEDPKAWPYGPVFPRSQKKVDYSNILPLDSPDFEDIKRDKKLTEAINYVIDKYSAFSASKLSEWSHQEGGPWYLATKQKGFNWNTPIPNEYIYEYFKRISV
jgi:Uncharacterized phage-associated protein